MMSLVLVREASPLRRAPSLLTLCAAVLWLCGATTQAIAQPSAVAPTMAAVPALKDLVELELEQLSRITVTSVALREQRLSDAPAAVYVISAEDIRRSGVTSLPEALRLAPNLQVARADANQYAITARGFNNVLANKMLVMIDGRTVYSPLFSGVFWEAQQVMLEDVDRIEVISGPGATLWGANAVNGVINIITRPPGETQGALVAAGGGNRERATSARWGGAAGEDGHYRVYAILGDRRNSRLETGPQVDDASSAFQAGFRYDSTGASRTLTLQGDAYRVNVDQDIGGSRDDGGANVLARWRQTLASGAFIDMQAYYDRVTREQPGAISETLDTWDVELHHGFQATPAQRVLWGGGARGMRDDLRNLSSTFAFRPDANTLSRAHVFAQDEIALGAALDLTLGLKLERNNYTGWEVLPDVRLAWRPGRNEMWWASLSRAVRSPSRIDREFFAPANPPFVFAGGPDFRSEVANVAEIGYRAQPSSAISYSLSVFHHDFERLRSTEPQADGTFLVENRMNAKLDGINGWGAYRLSPRLRLTGGFTWMRERRSLDPGSASFGGTAAAGNDPTHWVLLGASVDLSATQELDVRLRRVGALPTGPVPAYTAVDARYGWKIAKELELSLAAQNLFDRRHPEWGTPTNRVEVERGFFLKLLWRH